jgi:hypothetical protein
VQLLGVDHAVEATRIVGHLLEVFHAVELPLAGLLDHVPRHALLAVVLGGHRADDLLGELVAVRLPFELFVSQAEIHEMPPNSG